MDDSIPRQKMVDGKDQRPLVSLVMNFTKPTDTKPSLLTFNEVTTFLHEFGHALHGMFSKCTYGSTSMDGVSRDFVELPSQFMENYAASGLIHGPYTTRPERKFRRNILTKSRNHPISKPGTPATVS